MIRILPFRSRTSFHWNRRLATRQRLLSAHERTHATHLIWIHFYRESKKSKSKSRGLRPIVDALRTASSLRISSRLPLSVPEYLESIFDAPLRMLWQRYGSDTFARGEHRFWRLKPRDRVCHGYTFNGSMLLTLCVRQRWIFSFRLNGETAEKLWIDRKKKRPTKSRPDPIEAKGQTTPKVNDRTDLHETPAITAKEPHSAIRISVGCSGRFAPVDTDLLLPVLSPANEEFTECVSVQRGHLRIGRSTDLLLVGQTTAAREERNLLLRVHHIFLYRCCRFALGIDHWWIFVGISFLFGTRWSLLENSAWFIYQLLGWVCPFDHVSDHAVLHCWRKEQGRNSIDFSRCSGRVRFWILWLFYWEELSSVVTAHNLNLLTYWTFPKLFFRWYSCCDNFVLGTILLNSKNDQMPRHSDSGRWSHVRSISSLLLISCSPPYSPSIVHFWYCKLRWWNKVITITMNRTYWIRRASRSFNC